MRFDKRGVGQSTNEVPEEAMTLETFVADAAAVFARACGDARFSSVTALGHSEGGLIALKHAGRRAFDRVVLVATPGRPLHEVMERLRAANPRARVTVLAEMNHLLKVPAADAPCTKWPLAPGLVDAVVAGVVSDGGSTPM